jgi:hypothetical protein
MELRVRHTYDSDREWVGIRDVANHFLPSSKGRVPQAIAHNRRRQCAIAIVIGYEVSAANMNAKGGKILGGHSGSFNFPPNCCKSHVWRKYRVPARGHNLTCNLF